MMRTKCQKYSWFVPNTTVLVRQASTASDPCRVHESVKPEDAIYLG